MIEAQGYRVVVELLPYENDDLEFTDTYKEVQQRGKVVGVGTGTIREDGVVIKPDVSVGDIVMVTQTGGTMVQDGEKKYQIVSPDNILCKVYE